MRGIYSLYGNVHNVENVDVEAQHNYNRDSREAVYRFFGKHLLDDTDAADFPEKPYTLEKPEDMLALHGRKFPENAKNYEELFRYWRESAARSVRANPGSRHFPDAVSDAPLPRRCPHRSWPRSRGEKIAIGRRAAGSLARDAGGPARAHRCCWSMAMARAEALKNPQAQAALAAKRPVLLIDAFQTGSSIAVRDRSHRYFLTFNRSDDANRVQDILTALGLRNAKPGKIELRGSAQAGIWCTFAAAVAGMDLKLKADPMVFEEPMTTFLSISLSLGFSALVAGPPASDRQNTARK